MSQSLKVCSDCIQQAKLAFQRNRFRSQRAFAEALGFALSTVSKFLREKTVEYTTFVEICGKLALDWRAIADLGLPPQPVELKLSRLKTGESQQWILPRYGRVFSLYVSFV